MKRTVQLLVTGAFIASASTAAQAHGNVGFSVTFGVPAYVPPPVYYAPPPVYYAPPPTVYYGPPRVYYGPRAYYGPPAHYGGHRHWRGHGHKHGRHGGW